MLHARVLGVPQGAKIARSVCGIGLRLTGAHTGAGAPLAERRLARRANISTVTRRCSRRTSNRPASAPDRHARQCWSVGGAWRFTEALHMGPVLQSRASHRTRAGAAARPHASIASRCRTVGASTVEQHSATRASATSAAGAAPGTRRGALRRRPRHRSVVPCRSPSCRWPPRNGSTKRVAQRRRRSRVAGLPTLQGRRR